MKSDMKHDGLRIPRTGEVYRHYKGNFYIVVGHAHDTETGEVVVIYKHLDQRNNRHAFLWARPLKIWSKPVKVGNREIERFALQGGTKL